MTDPPSALLQRAADVMHAEAPVELKPMIDWMREVAKEVEAGMPWTHARRHAVECARQILGVPSEEGEPT